MNMQEVVRFCAECSGEHHATLVEAIADPLARGFLVEAIEQTEGEPRPSREIRVTAIAKMGLDISRATKPENSNHSNR